MSKIKSKANKQSRPNVVFVITDDQGYGDLGCTGNPIIKTPNIDKLYSESVRFTDFHVGPTCAPTRAGLLTGHFHNSTGVWHTIGGRSLLRKDEVSLATIFSQNGYKTGIFGKWHLGDNYPYRPHDRGFQEAVVHGGGGIGQTPDYWGNDYFDDTYFVNGEPQEFDGYCTDVFFNLGLEFIERNKDVPFFCYIPTNAPHSPFRVDEKYSKQYEGATDSNRARFYGMITNIDENLGKLREKLDELNISDNTIIIFMTDNGTAGGCSVDENGFVINGYNAGMRGVKASAYEGGHRVPFFLRWATGGFDKAQDIDELTANVDFLPTLIDICELNKPEGLTFDGTSLYPLMSEETEVKGRILVTDNQRVPNPIKGKGSCAMMDKWRLINGKELYDISVDKEQRNDIANKHPEIVEILNKGYEDWWNKVSIQFDEDIPISVGSNYEIVTDLTSHDCRGDIGEAAWNQGEIRQGKICNSYWEIFVEKEGKYNIKLRRWPIEEDRKLTEGIEGEVIDWYSGGRAIPIMKATIKVVDASYAKQTAEKSSLFTPTDNNRNLDIEMDIPVNSDEKYSEFNLELNKGNVHLYAYFTDEEGNEINAYYTYVEYVG